MNPEQRRQLCEMFRKDPTLNYVALAKLFGTNNGTIQNVLKRNGFVLDPRRRLFSFPTSKFENARWSANKKGIPFQITKENLQTIWEVQQGVCAYSGRKIQFPSSTRIFDGTASLDRIDSTCGYIVGDIQWVLEILPALKGEDSYDCSQVSGTLRLLRVPALNGVLESGMQAFRLPWIFLSYAGLTISPTAVPLLGERPGLSVGEIPGSKRMNKGMIRDIPSFVKRILNYFLTYLLAGLYPRPEGRGFTPVILIKM